MLRPFFSRSLFALAALAPLHSEAQIVVHPKPSTANGQLVHAGLAVDNVFIPGAGAVSASRPANGIGGFNIVINAGTGLSNNAAALAAFNRAAAVWVQRIADPITVTIDADLAVLGSGIIGSTSSFILEGGYTEVRDQMVVDAGFENDDAIVSHLPTVGQFSALVPDGGTLLGNILLSKANAKALGFTGLDEIFGASDGGITFSSEFNFDYDRSDGVGAGLIDFESVALHEIGHALGFTSIVDAVNGGLLTDIRPFTLDLFRFSNGTAADPSTTAEFTAAPRDFIPGREAVFDEIGGSTPEYDLSTGLVTGNFNGTDGRQASHWKDADLTGFFIGAMDPTIAEGQIFDPTEADFRALDLIGYDISSVPEPSSILLGLGASLVVFGSRRRLRVAR